MIGYSHGGGAEYQLAREVNKRIPGTWVPYTAYIDAVQKGKITPETRRPPGSIYHANYWQQNLGEIPEDFQWIQGSSMANAEIDDNVDAAGGIYYVGANERRHTNIFGTGISESPLVQTAVINGLKFATPR